MKISNPWVGFTVSFLLIPNFLFGNQDGFDTTPETEDQKQIEQETNSPNTATSTPQASDRPIEEIQVLGTRTLYSIRMEIVDEENKIFSMFNELNSDDRFDILCDKIAPTGSHIQQRVCEPRFVTETRAQMTQDYVRGIGMLVESSAVMAETAIEREEIAREHLRIAAEYPEYLEMLTALTNLRATLKSRRDAQWGKLRDLFDNQTHN
tara:strand:- start:1227 stop:1850 length:624 start_codon:yes stop_codon:yes gene_type:complete